MRTYFYNLATDKNRGLVAGILKACLFVLSLAYGLAVRLSALFWGIRSCRLGCRLIGVGNITLGGTGKTTLVGYIARYLKEKGRRVAILSRGYKGADEARMLLRYFADIPVVVDADRIRGAKRAIKEYGADTLVLDDAFQQWRIIKDLEIVAIDATNPFGNGRLLPRGILREPLSALKRADVFVLAKTNLASDASGLKAALAKINPQAEVFTASHCLTGFYEIGAPDKLFSPQALRGKTAALFSGIGDPASFESLVKLSGINPGLIFEFIDHHQYTAQDLKKIFQGARQKGIDTLITTEKDAARLSGLDIERAGLSVLVSKIAIEIRDEERFRSRLSGLSPR
jgi:tetraacyldisaccharide 4'-kinase